MVINVIQESEKSKIIHVIQEEKDTKKEYLDTIEDMEKKGYIIFDIGSYNKREKLSEAVLILEKKVTIKHKIIKFLLKIKQKVFRG